MLAGSKVISSGEYMRTMRSIVTAGLSSSGGGTVESIKSAATLAVSSLHVGGLSRLFANPLFHRYVVQRSRSDPLFAIRHRHFLARGLSMTQRVRCAASHFEFEEAHCGADYHNAVHGPKGLTLWRTCIGDNRYSIVLQDSGTLRHEGPLSVVLKADEQVLHVTSFAWVPVHVVEPHANGGAAAAMTMFVARNQSQRASAASMVRFRADFPQNAPAYFCFAATLAVAQAHGLTCISAVHHERQVAYERQLASGFKRSYCDFWTAFGGECDGGGVYRMSVPIHMPPLDRVASNHRARARARRAHWIEINRATLDTLRPHLECAPRALPQHPAPAMRGMSALLGSPLVAWLPEWLEQLPLLAI